MATEQDKQAELERVTRNSGFRFGLHDFYAEVDPQWLKQRNDRWEAIHDRQPLIDRKTEELIRIGVYVALRASEPHIQMHIHAAHKAGATPEQIRHVLERVGTWAGAVTTVKGLEAWRAAFRPDIPPINRLVELR